MVFQELLGVVAALAQAHLAVVEPCAALLDDTQLDAKVKNFTDLRDALTEHNIKLGLTERGRDLVFHNLGAGAVADERTGGVLQALDAAHVDPHAGIVLARVRRW